MLGVLGCADPQWREPDAGDDVEDAGGAPDSGAPEDAGLAPTDAGNDAGTDAGVTPDGGFVGDGGTDAGRGVRTLVFADEFDGSTLSTQRWRYRTGDRHWCRNLPDNVSVSGGSLRIALQKQSFDGGPGYSCGGVISNESFSYGYYEARAKLWGARGWHSSFWSMGSRNEIDGFEIDSAKPSLVTFNTHYYDPTHANWRGGVYPFVDTSADFHVYAWEWAPDRVRWFVDGVAVGTVSYPGPHQPQNLWLTSIASWLGGGADAGVDDSALPGEVEFDYVRYYTRDDGLPVPDAGRVIAPGTSGYQERGSWSSADVAGYDGAPARHSTDADGGATVSWSSPLSPQQEQDVFVWMPSHRLGAADAGYLISHAGGTSILSKDQREEGNRWLYLGRYVMRPGDGVSLSVNGPERHLASAALFVPASLSPSVVILPTDPGYQERGAWGPSSLLGFQGSPVRYCCTDGGVGATRWTPELPQAGRYLVSIYKSVYSGADTKARIDIDHAGGTDVLFLDYSRGTTGWVDLGVFDFDAGTAGSVQLLQSSPSVRARANATRFLRWPDN